MVLPDGEIVHLGGPAPEYPGYDLLGAFVGSEGTLGVATEVTLRLVRVPETVQTMLVGFRSVEDAGRDGQRHHRAPASCRRPSR